MNSEIEFADKNLIKTFEKLKHSKTEDKKLYGWLNRAFEDIERNIFCGRQIPKKQIPKRYIEKYKINNLWKYDLPSGWRLVYSVANDKPFIISLILEWFPHKEYKKRFKYL